MTVPLIAIGDIIGALTFERSNQQPFDHTDVEYCADLAAFVGPVLQEKRLNDRWILTKLGHSIGRQTVRMIGPHFYGRKLAAITLIAIGAILGVAEGDYTVTATSRLEGIVQRALVAPFDGYVATASARAGDTVAERQVLATLDARDIVLERAKAQSVLRQYEVEYDQALATGDPTAAKIARAQIDQANTQILLQDEQLARSKIVAPFAGLIIEGDLSRSLGSPVRRGDMLFQLAPLDDYRVILEVDERDIADVAAGQAGVMVVSSVPDHPLPIVVRMITPVSLAKDGHNLFRVEAALVNRSDIARLRPGMEGVGRIEIDRRKLLWIWTHELVDWARLTFWRWWP